MSAIGLAAHLTLLGAGQQFFRMAFGSWSKSRSGSSAGEGEDGDEGFHSEIGTLRDQIEELKIIVVLLGR
jgi:hypothetical protein